MSNASGTDFRGTQNSDMAKELAKLKQELSASQAREADLSYQLHTALGNEMTWRGKAEAAESKIKALQEREMVLVEALTLITTQHYSAGSACRVIAKKALKATPSQTADQVSTETDLDQALRHQ